MPRVAKRLTVRDIERIPFDKDSFIACGGTPGLYVQTYSKSRRKVFYLRQMIDGKYISNAIGEFDPTSTTAITLEEARRKAVEVGKSNRRTTQTLYECVEHYVTKVLARGRKNIDTPMTYVRLAQQAPFGGTEINRLARKELVAFLETYGEKSPVAAATARIYWSDALNVAVDRGEIDKNPLKGVKTRSLGIAPAKSRERVLTDAEINKLQASDDAISRVLLFILATGCRITETLLARKEHITDNVLTIPASNNKAGREHRVFLTPYANQQIINPEAEGPLFPVRIDAVQRYCRRVGEGWTPHDCRRTFATLAASLGQPPHAIELCLNHLPNLGGSVAGTYNRFDYWPDRVSCTKAVSDKLDAVSKTNDRSIMTAI